MESIVTADLGNFGHREREMATELMNAWSKQGLPENFYDDKVSISFNTHSGCVFLTNSEYQAAMMNGDKLEIWHNCPYCGHEGFKGDMDHDAENAECTRYLVEIGVKDDDEEED